ncbi:MAG: 4Fe-4S binding protein [Anaerolineaceae bacterium]|nr:4Fe-4S binding protein [Anaerolineaceae bacterium]
MDNWSIPSIDMERCTGCGLCVEYCPTKAVTMVHQQPVIHEPRLCTYCGLCEDSCPEDAITLLFEIVPRPPANQA